MKKKYQGELMPVIRGNGISQMIYVYENSSDFPDYDIVILGVGKNYEKSFEAERIPINEELWRKIGKALNYRFVIRKKAKKKKSVKGYSKAKKGLSKIKKAKIKWN